MSKAVNNAVVGIRPAVQADFEQLFVMAKALATSFEVNKPDFKTCFDALLEEQNQGRVAILVAQIADGLVGYALGYLHNAFYANGTIAWLEELFVNEDRRGVGIGKSLLTQFENWASGHGARLNALATRRAETFYQACGYEVSATYFKKHL